MKLFFYALLPALLLLFAAPALAINKQQAIHIAQQNNPGRVLAVNQNAQQFRVKILSANGDVRIIIVDAKSGKVTH